MLEKLPPELQHTLMALAALFPTALLGRFLYHARLVRLGRRRFWGRELWWEVPTAALCAIVGGGLAEYFALPPLAVHAVVGVAGWLGPRGIEVAAIRVLDRVAPDRNKEW